MKIHIITGHFYPQLHPRAFRANELALEFSRRGHNVTVTNCWTMTDFDYDAYAKENNLSIVNMGLTQTKSNVSGKKAMFSSDNRLSSLLRFLKEYLLAGSIPIRTNKIAKNLAIAPNTDMVIALSTPFSCLWGLPSTIVNNILRHHGSK